MPIYLYTRLTCQYMSGSLLTRNRVTHIICPIINISCETVIIVIQLDNISCRFDFIPSRRVDIWGGILKIMESCKPYSMSN